MIEVTNITKKFGKLQVLKGISAKCEAAQCIALIGPNGCGKTTLIKNILGMVVPDSGTITVLGTDISRGWKYRSAIGYMPQIGKYPENMKIGQVIEMLMDIRRMEQKTDEDLINAFALPQLYHKRMGTLSGGTMQKVSAAIAFLFKPQILILDEPTAGLDPVASEILKEKIITEKENGKLFIITSHILSELDELVSRVIYMHDGNILFNNTIEALKADTGETKLSRAIAHFMSKN
ncbi:MAG: transporter ATP-binding protein [Flavipsychrobacter sp.]|jgi:Cu-processing system ATP-binding protein|nr:transporter ATP-binding protein [Flavipsychrobacter sp.]